MSANELWQVATIVEELGTPSLVADQARTNLARGRVHLLALTGRLGSGKDSLGRLAVEEAMRADGLSGPVQRVAFGRAIVTQGDSLLHAVNAAADTSQAVREAAARLDLPAELVAPIVELVWQSVRDGVLYSARQRLPVVRRALQLLGDARRAVEPDYWVRIGMASVVAAAAQGRSVYLPDVRTTAEADGARRIGCLLVRVMCDEQTRRRRLITREGTLPDGRAAVHPTETAMDAYPNIDLCVSNDRDADLESLRETPQVQAIVGSLTARHSTITEDSHA